MSVYELGDMRPSNEEAWSHTMKRLFVLAGLALAFALPGFAQKTSAPAQINVLIEANEWNRKQLLEKLTENGAKQGMKFISVEKGYDYKIRFTTGKTQEAVVVQGTGGTTDYDTGFATVYDSHDAELFQIKREAWWSERGATNKIAKEIIKRIRQLRPPKADGDKQ